MALAGFDLVSSLDRKQELEHSHGVSFPRRVFTTAALQAVRTGRPTIAQIEEGFWILLLPPAAQATAPGLLGQAKALMASGIQAAYGWEPSIHEVDVRAAYDLASEPWMRPEIQRMLADERLAAFVLLDLRYCYEYCHWWADQRTLHLATAWDDLGGRFAAEGRLALTFDGGTGFDLGEAVQRIAGNLHSISSLYHDLEGAVALPPPPPPDDAPPPPALYQCPSCETYVTESAAVCPSCGAEFEG